MNLAEELKARGLVQQEGGGSLEEILKEKRTVYLGVDPTADSLHVGNMVPIMLLRHLSEAGNKVIFLIGGGTGMIGDPRESGERTLLDSKVVAKNTKAIRAQMAPIFGKHRLTYVDNAVWISRLGAIEFLRDVGKHFTVNQLVKRDIIKKRLDAEDPISFTEFSYSLLQGYDYWHLNKKYGVDLQVGGSDQWANIISGVDLVRRKEGKDVYAITTPIITEKGSGKKFGKSEGNAIWLAPKKTSPFQFYQFWLNIADDSVDEYLKIFTLFPLSDIEAILNEHTPRPQERIAQKKLAHAVTTLVHGKSTADTVARISGILFNGESLTTLGRGERSTLLSEVPHKAVHTRTLREGVLITTLLVDTGLSSSQSDARRLIEGKGVSVGGVKVEKPDALLSKESSPGEMILLRRGKQVAIIVIEK